ncbi:MULTISPECIES: DUF4827 family protein [unclassified Parabacteroides]|uniref:DUF4827 family protein n=1 Tax=unclassified Parabacteroides TaxID=2649774 RepID=UPI000EFF33CB|nr:MULTISPECIES: DUF4827 family protein [unclassified Parabacteroides]RHO65481.1 DUF4827 family protein [Parabacteroides sp. AF48-14]RHR61755.1 DUF4827 family protein [Parabacteroides sp. AF17-28]
MKRGFYILLIMCAAIMVVSCDKTKSYTDMLKAQQKAIDRLEKDSGLVFLDDFPKDSIFKENEFVKLEDGVYLNIIEKGNSERAVMGKTDVQTRFMATLFMESSSFGTGTVDLLGPHSNGTHPVEFKYGYYSEGLYSYYYNIFISPGLAAGLPYVGDSAYVKLIVPFKQMGTLGDFQSTGTPVYFEKVRYIFKK